EELRRAYRDGKFEASLRDDEWQVIPSAWVMAAQERWLKTGGRPPANAPMSAMAIDVAQGGADQTALVWRYDAWFDKPVVKPGSETPTGSEAAALVIQHRRNGATIVVDEGGGFGGATIQRLKDNFINPVGFNGAKGTNKRSQDRRLTFAN